MNRTAFFASSAALALFSATACAQDTSYADAPFEVTEVAQFTQPWAMTFLPDGKMLVTEKGGTLRWATRDGEVSEPIAGVPDVDYGNQGGLGDVILHPDFENNSRIYISYAEAGDDDTRGGAVAMATLTPSAEGGELTDLEVIWRQYPKTTGRGHYSYRMAFSPDGEYLFISSGDRQKFTPAQDMEQNLGKIIRLRPDGSIPEDNPFVDQGGIAAQVWTLGMRNPLGIAFDADGVLWEHEMGPRHGDEFQRIVRGENYGYPVVSNGDHYSGEEIPDHDTRPEFRAPETYWVPAISPAGLMFYSGDLFADWKGDAFIGGLSSQAMVRVSFDCEGEAEACEAARYSIDDQRIREVEQGPDGAIWVLQDQRRPEGEGGKLVKLTPAE
ncbi:MAG: PQQ-dependent sugar dehydrogenase [Pseudomonadota bacterium]